MHHGDNVFKSYGIYNREYYNWQTDLEIVKRWRHGQTGMPFIDAQMREMNETGFMSHRGRMVVATYLAQDIRQDWLFGAHWFE
jgi:deoxyribodipyrimidine photo-lyase